MRRYGLSVRRAVTLAAALLVAAPSLPAQAPARGEPHAGYVFPAGVQRGTSREVVVGGQFLDGVASAIVSGQGVTVEVIKYTKPPTNKQLNDVRQYVKELRKKKNLKDSDEIAGLLKPEEVEKIENKTGMSLKELMAYGKKLRDPKTQPNPQLGETVTLHVSIDPDAAPGQRELRLRTPKGLSNPIFFQVGQYREYDEREPNESSPDPGVGDQLPVVINGQILPGDVDRFRFEASAGDRLVVAASARELIPFLADAVPGWFQATLALYDSEGTELAFADDYRFHPDPVLHCEIPEDGDYTLEIRDSIYRGREDFVYRIALGELPLLTGVFPLGAPAGAPADVEVTGWNLPVERMEIEAPAEVPGVRPVSVRDETGTSNAVPFDVDTMPECLEAEPNDDAPNGNRLELPRIVNGRIEQPGDLDVFRFQGRKGQKVVLEVRARRLGSPLDSVLVLTDRRGREIASNDDCLDEGCGLATHHADSVVAATLPANGAYYAILRDAQNAGGPEYAYRLRLSERRPDFELRAVPSSVNVRAGTATLITVHALRKDGFQGRIDVSLKDAPPGFFLSGGWIPKGQAEGRMTLSVPPEVTDQPLVLQLEGTARIAGEAVRHAVVPAEDMTQAFVLHHLVTSDDLLVTVTENKQARNPVKLLGKTPVKLPAGGTAVVDIRLPNARRFRTAGVKLELSRPPEGITVGELAFERDQASFSLAVDGDAVEPGLQGNLIVEAWIEREIKSRDGKPTGRIRRVPAGILPAVPFEVVEPE